MTYHIWHLTRVDDHYGYDEMRECIVIAASPVGARKAADTECVDEGPIWTNPSRVACKRLGQADMPCKPGVVMRDVAWAG
jgi:hypothetical protein